MTADRKTEIESVVTAAYQTLMPYGGFKVEVMQAGSAYDVKVRSQLKNFDFREGFSVDDEKGEVTGLLSIRGQDLCITRGTLVETVELAAKALGMKRMVAVPILAADRIFFAGQGYVLDEGRYVKSLPEAVHS